MVKRTHRSTDIPLRDRGHYYRGLLVLIRRDRIINAREHELMLKLGRTMDFDMRFCEAAIKELVKNPHIKDEPMIFSDRKVAESFVRDAVALAAVDGEIHPRELDWLKAVAAANGLKKEWVEIQLNRLMKACVGA